MFQTNIIEKIETHISCSVVVFRKSCRFWGNTEKFYRAIQVSDDNRTHARFFLYTEVYIHTLSGYVIFIAFPLQQWLTEIATTLNFTYISCLVEA